MLPLASLLSLASAGRGPAENIAFFSAAGLLALVTLAALEIVLGIDNVIVIALLSNKLPPEKRVFTQRLGIICAVVTRIGLLFCISLLMQATKVINPDWPEIIPGYLHLGLISWKDLILVAGGFFLIWKSTKEIHHHLQQVGSNEETPKSPRGSDLMVGVIAQIMLVDIIFSLDSVITAVGMSSNLSIMISAVILSACVMVVFAKPVAGFIEKNPTVKVLALAFLILVGVAIIAEGLPHNFVKDADGKAVLDAKGQIQVIHHKISKGIIYVAMVFSLAVEFINIAARRKGEKAIKLTDSHLPDVKLQ